MLYGLLLFDTKQTLALKWIFQIKQDIDIELSAL